MNKLLLVLLFIFFLINVVSAQSRSELEKQRLNSLKEIKYTNELIKLTEKNKKISYNKLLLINKKISARKDVINSINEEINYLNNNIEIHQEIIIGLEEDLKKLKSEYANIIYHSYIHKNKYDKLMFVLASENINTAFRRIKYLQQYSEYRIKQAESIVSTKIEIGEKIIELEILIADKKDLLIDEKIENQKLIVEKNDKNNEVKKLASKHNELKLKLRKQNEIADRLKKEIARIIEEEARLAAEKSSGKGSGFFSLTPEEKLIASVFSKNKTRLPWPTERGVITGKFGEQPHPVLKGIKIRNDGVDISTNQGSTVRSIYEGTVSRVFSIPGAHKTIIIRHGNYLTVYSNLKEVFVNQGDKVDTKQTIGIINTDNDKDHKTVLQFQIWKENEKLNPLEWLAKGNNG